MWLGVIMVRIIAGCCIPLTTMKWNRGGFVRFDRRSPPGLRSLVLLLPDLLVLASGREGVQMSSFAGGMPLACKVEGVCVVWLYPWLFLSVVSSLLFTK